MSRALFELHEYSERSLINWPDLLLQTVLRPCASRIHLCVAFLGIFKRAQVRSLNDRVCSN